MNRNEADSSRGTTTDLLPVVVHQQLAAFPIQEYRIFSTGPQIAERSSWRLSTSAETLVAEWC